MTSTVSTPVKQLAPRRPRRQRMSADAIMVPHPPLSGDKGSRAPCAQRRMRRRSADDVASAPTIETDSHPSLPPLIPSPSKRTLSYMERPSQLAIVPSWEDNVESTLPPVGTPSHGSLKSARVPSVETFSPTKKTKTVPLPPQPEDLKARLLAAAATAPNNPTRAARTVMHNVNRVIRLYETAAKVSGLCYDVKVAFPSVLRKEFPLASSAEIRAMVEFMEARVEADALRRAREAERWAEHEKGALAKLFRTLAGARRTMDEASFEMLASLAEIPRAELREACARASEVAKASGAHDRGLDLGQFLALIESLPAHVVGAIRRVLPGVCASSPEVTASRALVFDDGRQQLWRLNTPRRTSAPSIVREDTREAEWRRALGDTA